MPADVVGVADLHATAIDEGFLASLGPRFLRRLYRRVLASRHGFLLVAEEAPGGRGPGPALGFVAGGLDVRRLYRQFLVHDGIPAALGSAPQLIRSVPRALETLRYGAGAGHRADPAGHDPSAEAELLAVAVADGHRRRGVGAALVEAFVARATDAGSASARVVVGSANAQAIAMYRAAGFEPDHTLELHEGATSVVLRTALAPGPRP